MPGDCLPVGVGARGWDGRMNAVAFTLHILPKRISFAYVPT